jgi:hypothetical protein
MSTSREAAIVNAETAGIVEVRQSPLAMLGLIVVGFVLIALCAAMAFHRTLGMPASGFEEFVGYVGVVFFGLCTGVGLWRMLSVRGPVVTITPEGIRDTRVAAEVIPWSAITGISTWQYRRQKIMVLAMDPVAESRLSLTRMARWSREPNRALGADGLCIAVTGLNIKYDALLRTCLAYAQSRKRAAQ